jgi:lysophospholipase L1-like esterase
MGLVLGLSASAQLNDAYPTYWNQRATLFEVLPITSSDIVFVGNSITDGGEWWELFQTPGIKNRGISGDTSRGVYDRLAPIVGGKPKKVFLMIGINDLSRGLTIDSIARNVAMIVDRLQAESPATKIYIQSTLPVSDEKNMFQGHSARRADVAPLNELYKQLCIDRGLTYIDLYSHFVDPATGKMNLNYSNDGLHLLGEGYILWGKIAAPYVAE